MKCSMRSIFTISILLLAALAWTFVLEPRRRRSRRLPPEPLRAAPPPAIPAPVPQEASKELLRSLERMEADLGEIKFDKLGESMGAYGERVSDPAQLKPALQRALATGGCAVIHVDVDPVKHMWAPGLIHFKKMHEEPKA